MEAVDIDKHPISVGMLVRACIREAVEPGRIGSGSYPQLSSCRGCEHVAKAVARAASILVSRRGPSLYCRLCGGGPYTKKGAYLHLLRKHSQDIKRILEEELRAAVEQEA